MPFHFLDKLYIIFFSHSSYTILYYYRLILYLRGLQTRVFFMHLDQKAKEKFTYLEWLNFNSEKSFKYINTSSMLLWKSIFDFLIRNMLKCLVHFWNVVKLYFVILTYKNIFLIFWFHNNLEKKLIYQKLFTDYKSVYSKYAYFS